MGRRTILAGLLMAAMVALESWSAESSTAMPRTPLAAAGRAAPPTQLWLHGGPGTRLAAHTGGLDYRRALWEPASRANYTASDRGLGDIRRIVIHVAEGGFRSTYQWFKNPAAQASAHYVVSSKGRVAQMVSEQNIAWHAGNWSYNVSSIGIEHAGYTNVTHFRDSQYRGSARLAGSITHRYLIAPDRKHVIGHNEVPDPFHKGEFGGADHHTDPGRTWNWPLYMAYLRFDSKQTWSSTVDDAEADHSGAWVRHSASGATGGEYLQTPSHRRDPVSYTFDLPHDDGYDVFARWPCASGLAPAVTVHVVTASGVASRTLDQRRCRAWRYVGTWRMAAGSGPRVLIGSRAAQGGSAIADAVRLDETSDPVDPASVPVSTTAAPTSLGFSWAASHDDRGIGAYQLWVDGHRAYEGTGLALTVTGLACGTSHLISLRAVDLSGNRSRVDRFTASTLACPEPVVNLHVTGQTQTSITLDWQDGGGTVRGYDVYGADGLGLLGQPATPGLRVTALTCGSSYTFTVRAFDDDGDRSPRVQVTAQTAGC
jgi:hypothetical protein